MHRTGRAPNHRFENFRLMADIAIDKRAAFGGAAIAEQTGRDAAETVLQCETMGRHAAPVLHDPGTSTTVGPCPLSS